MSGWVRSMSIAAGAWGLVCAAAAQQLPSSGTADASPAQSGQAQPQTMEQLSGAELLRRNGGSLFRATVSVSVARDPAKMKAAGGISYFAVPEPEPKTIKKHDLITIIIREEAEMSSDGSTDLKKEADLDARLEEWVKFKPGNFALEGGAQGDNPPSVKLGGKRNFKGEATVDRTDSFITRISAEVVDVKPNGTFAIQARKWIKHDEEEQEYLLTGVCRAADLTPDNTLLSTQIHNLEIVTSHKGAVHDTNKRGWVPKLLDFVNPF